MPLRTLMIGRKAVPLRAVVSSLVCGHLAALVLVANANMALASLIWCLGFGPVLALLLLPKPDRKWSAPEFIQTLRSLSGFERSVATAFLALTAVYLRLALAPEAIGGPSLILLTPVALAAFLFGLAPGLWAALCIAAFEWFLTIPPRFTLWFENWGDAESILALLGVAGCAALIFQELYKATVGRSG